MEGCWESVSAEITLSECWLRDGQALQGQGRIDDEPYENTVIAPTEEGPRYVVRRPDGVTTTFVVTKATDSVVRFENPENSAATWIEYRRDGDGITGSFGTGSEAERTWRFTRR